jgi:lipoate-protein ligase A
MMYEPKRWDMRVSVEHDKRPLGVRVGPGDEIAPGEPRRGRTERVRLVVDEPLGGAWNMAVDEVLLEDATNTGSTNTGPMNTGPMNTAPVCLRLYRWREPTLTLGYFQAYDERRAHRPSARCPVVRRSSGGGAILHDHELTYSLAIPAGHQLARRPDDLYGRVHKTLARALGSLGVETQPHGDAATTSDASAGRAASPFLCFKRRSPVDLVQGDRKIVGSAQRRRRGAVLQHGSVLLATSLAAPEVPGPVCKGASLDVEGFASRWWEELAGELGWTPEPACLTDRQRRRAEELVAEKYGQVAWTQRR